MNKKSWENSPEKPFTTKVSKHLVFVYSIFTQCSFDSRKSKHDYYRGKSCMKKFCRDLREHATKAINCEKMKIVPWNSGKWVILQWNNLLNMQKSLRPLSHYTGKCRGVTYKKSSLKCKITKKFHYSLDHTRCIKLWLSICHSKVGRRVWRTDSVLMRKY